MDHEDDQRQQTNRARATFYTHCACDTGLQRCLGCIGSEHPFTNKEANSKYNKVATIASQAIAYFVTIEFT